jgi:hypothetical protein
MIILNRIASLSDLDLLQASHGPHHRQLHLLGKRGGNPVRVDKRIVQPFRLQEDLVTVRSPNRCTLSSIEGQ